MLFEISDLIVLCLLILSCSYFWSAQRIKEFAYLATRAHCKQVDVQLLDQGIYLRGLWIKRDEEGRVRVWRSFNFEFTSNGVDRYKGLIVLLGKKVQNIELEVHRV